MLVYCCFHFDIEFGVVFLFPFGILVSCIVAEMSFLTTPCKERANIYMRYHALAPNPLVACFACPK